MLYVNVKAARELSMQRLLEEVGMCQSLCKTMDEQLSPYMTILGRMAVLNVMQRFEELPTTHQDKVFNEWAGEMHWYGPWSLVREKRNMGLMDKLPEETNLAYFLDRDIAKAEKHNRLLDPGFPWGVLTLGGLMRAYAECSEMIFGEIEDPTTTLMKKNSQGLSTGVPVTTGLGRTLPSTAMKDGWQKRRIMEEQGRLSWQRNLIKQYGYDLFKKKQIQAFGLTKAQKQLTKEEQKRILEQNLINAQKKLGETEGVTNPTEDRMRFVRKLKDVEGARDWLDEYEKLEPKWTKGGRMKWQTFLKDRISLVGDLYGLVRGATISGTTSDHAYSFFQLCHDVHTMDRGDDRYAILTRPSTKTAFGIGAWSYQTRTKLETAFTTMQTDQGFGQIVRMMMLIPIVQMGIEMHHSVHEMASVVGLNDLINWEVGYYDSLFMSLKELRRLENSMMAELRRKAGIKKSSATKPTISTGPLTKVEDDINESSPLSSKIILS